MSDGYLTLALLRNRGEATPSGINHFGFQVDDIKDTEQRLKKFDEPLESVPQTAPMRSIARWTRMGICSTFPRTGTKRPRPTPIAPSAS